MISALPILVLLLGVLFPVYPTDSTVENLPVPTIIIEDDFQI